MNKHILGFNQYGLRHSKTSNYVLTNKTILYFYMLVMWYNLLLISEGHTKTINDGIVQLLLRLLSHWHTILEIL